MASPSELILVSFIPTEGFIESMLECCQPTSLDHMDHVRDHEVAALAKSDTVVTFVLVRIIFLDWNNIHRRASLSTQA